jgi:hypothetical protein
MNRRDAEDAEGEEKKRIFWSGLKGRLSASPSAQNSEISFWTL